MARIVLALAAVVLVSTGIVLLIRQFEAGNARVRSMATESVRADGDHRVLFISSYSQAHFSVPLQWEGIDETLEAQGVALDTEYMDTKNHPDDRSIQRFTALLRGKLQTSSYDVLIVGDDAALGYAEEHRDDLFENMPVVFLGINDLDHARRVHQEGWATGVLEESNMTDVFSTMAGLFPQRHTFVCIVDNTPTGQGDLTELKRVQAKLEGYDFQVINTSELSKDELVKQVEAIGSDALVAELDAFEDADGNEYTIDQAVRLLTTHTSAPVFRVSTGGVGAGALGSGVLDFRTFGRQAAAMAIRIINGVQPGSIALAGRSGTAYVFDQTQLDRFDIPSRNLPERATVINGSRPVWEEYQAVLVPALLVVLGLVFVIAALVIGAVQSRMDARELRQSEARLRHELYYDTLTDLTNRKGLFKMDTSRYRSACALNIDGFKFINEKYGHAFGDEVLRELASRLTAIPGATAIRLGGDEFFLMFEDDVKAGTSWIAQVDKAINAPYAGKAGQVDLSVSAGIAQRKEGQSLDDLLTAAELALHEGRGDQQHHGIQIYNSKIKDEVDRRTALVEVLQRAVRQEAFTVLYQPQVIADTCEVYGLESLCRLENNTYFPDQFIPAAEESGLIVELDRIVTRKVVAQLGAWKRAGRRLPVVSLNYSSRQLRDQDYPRLLASLLDEQGVPHDRVKIEITERSVFSDRDRADAFFEQIHQMGMQIALDDFGTGYSSIIAMSALPVDFVKFDKSLADEYLVPDRLTFLADLTAIVHDLGKQVVAEGVETSEQFRLACQIGIDQIQGYYFDRPLPADKAIDAHYQG